MASIVSVVHARELSGEGINNATREAIEKSGFKLPEKLRSVLLKVNLRYYWDFSTGETTDPRVVSAIIDYVRGFYGHGVDIAIVEADASAMRTKHAFKMLGYERLAERKSVRLLNLCECEKVEKETIVKHERFSLPVARPLLDADLLINVPKLRTHRLVNITCSLKNLFGAIAVPRKIVYHPRLNEVIVAINKLVRPHLTVVDGIIALGKEPIKMGLVLASEDQLAVDYVAAEIMGYDPQRIEYLTLAERERVGIAKNIKVVGEDIGEFAKLFPTENYFVSNLLWNAKLSMLGMYLKVTKDTRPPVLDK